MPPKSGVSACKHGRSAARSDLLRHAVPRRDRVGLIRRAGQECIRANERLANAAVDLDVESVNHDPGTGALELLLRHRDGVDEPWLEADGDTTADVRADSRDD